MHQVPPKPVQHILNMSLSKPSRLPSLPACHACRCTPTPNISPGRHDIMPLLGLTPLLQFPGLLAHLQGLRVEGLRDVLDGLAWLSLTREVISKLVVGEGGAKHIFY